MSGALEMRSPAPTLASGKDRAQDIRNETHSSNVRPEAEADFAADYLARRFGLSRALSARAMAARLCDWHLYDRPALHGMAHLFDGDPHPAWRLLVHCRST